MLHLVLAQVKADRRRYVASGLAVFVAVAYIVATLALSHSASSGIEQSASAAYRGTSVVVSARDDADATSGSVVAGDPGATGLADADRDAGLVAGAPGVDAVALDLSAYGQIERPDGGRSFATVSTVAPEGPLRWQRLASGTWPTGPGEVVVDATSGLTTGDAVTLGGAADGVVASTRVVGTVDVSGTALATAQTVIYADRSDVVALAGGAPEWEIRAAAPDRDENEVADAIASVVGDRADVETGSARAAALVRNLGQMTTVLTAVLLCFAAIAVVVAGLVIANTFTVLAASRTADLALQRCVGVTVGQIRRSVLVEGAVVGVVASAAGVVAGLVFATGAVRIIRGTGLPLVLASVTPSFVAIAVGLAVGVLTTVAAAWGAAGAATRVPPLAALRPLETVPESVASSWTRRIVAALGLVGGAGLLAFGILDKDVFVACAGGLAFFVGFVLACRRIVPSVVAAFGRPIARRGGPLGELAVGNALRAPRRTAATATALLIGVTLTVTMVVGAGLLRSTVPTAMDDQFAVDIEAFGSSTALDPSLAERISALDGVAVAVAAPSVRVEADGVERVMTVADPALATAVRSPLTLPGAGTAVLGSGSFGDREVADGATVTLRGPSGERTVRAVRGDLMAITPDDAAALGAVPDASTMYVRLDDGLDDTEASRVSSAVNDRLLDADPFASVSGTIQMRRQFDQVIDVLVAVFGALLSIAVLIALIGVGNTMALAVIERRRETGLLRAVGLSRAGVRSTMVVEAGLVSFVACVVGAVLGTGFGLAGVAALFGANRVVLSGMPWLPVVGVLLAGSAAGVLAAVVPAIRASRTSPVVAAAA